MYDENPKWLPFDHFEQAKPQNSIGSCHSSS